MSRKKISDKDAKILSELAYLNLSGYVVNGSQAEGQSIHDIFYDQNGQIRPEIRKETKQNAALKDFVSKLDLHSQHYAGTLKNYNLLATSDNVINSNSGYYAIAVQRSNTNDTYIYNRGTEDVLDIISDFSMLGGNVTSQMYDAIAFTEALLQGSKKADSDFYITTLGFGGHSLGGAIAQILTAYFYKTVMISETKTFEAYGTENISSIPELVSIAADYFNLGDSIYKRFSSMPKEEQKRLIKNFIHSEDAVSWVSSHIGEVIEIDSDNGRNKRLRLDVHSINNYVYFQFDSDGSLVPGKLNLETTSQLYNALKQKLISVNKQLNAIEDVSLENAYVIPPGVIVRDEIKALIDARNEVIKQIADFKEIFSTMDNYNETAFAQDEDIESMTEETTEAQDEDAVEAPADLDAKTTEVVDSDNQSESLDTESSIEALSDAKPVNTATIADEIKDEKTANQEDSKALDNTTEAISQDTIQNAENAQDHIESEHIDQASDDTIASAINLLAASIKKALWGEDIIAKLSGFSLADAVFETFIAANQQRFGDPLVLDLDNNSINTISVNKQVMFDHNTDGIKYATGWVGAKDGLLVQDLNQNGLIDHGGELFGEHYIKSDGSKARDGFDALADLDSNGDGVISVADNAFNNLYVWQDKNSDAITQQGELYHISQTGITQISLTTSNENRQSDGGVIVKSSTYQTSDGNEAAISAINFVENHFF
ncbi:lipase family protein, partial [Facilibium subflavum]|uniref:lipase family protein n=1 Tax=Facilibium subflavum TaxID=2219058 RepID=UPI0038B332A5